MIVASNLAKITSRDFLLCQRALVQHDFDQHDAHSWLMKQPPSAQKAKKPARSHSEVSARVRCICRQQNPPSCPDRAERGKKGAGAGAEFATKCETCRFLAPHLVRAIVTRLDRPSCKSCGWSPPLRGGLKAAHVASRHRSTPGWRSTGRLRRPFHTPRSGVPRLTPERVLS